MMYQVQPSESKASVGHDATSGARPVLESFVVALLCAGFHTLLVVVIGALTRGSDFSDDIGFLLHFAQEPLQIIQGTGDVYPMFPPLMPLALSLFYKPYSLFLDDFYAMRMVSVTYEAIATFVIWLSACRVLGDFRKRVLFALCFLASPVGWMSTSFFSQEESISMLFMACIVLLMTRRRFTAAALVSALGVVFAKVYFLVPFVGICAIVSTNFNLIRGFKVCLISALPCLFVYLLQAYLRSHNGFSGDSFASFAPRLENSINVWAFVDYFYSIEPQVAKRISGVMALLCAMVVPVYCFFKGQVYNQKQMVALLGGMLAWVYAVFYHVNPEYFIIIAPCLILVMELKLFALVYVIALSVPWATNVFFGISNAVASGVEEGAKAKIAAIYSRLMPIDASSLFLVSLGLGALILFILALYLSIAVMSQSPLEEADSSDAI